MHTDRLYLTNRLHEWRERHFEAAALEFQQLAIDLEAEAASDIAALSNHVALLTQLGYVRRNVVPALYAAARATMKRRVTKANEELRAIAEQLLAWQEAQGDDEDDGALKAFGDVVAAAGPLAGGVAAAASLPGLAVTTTVSFFGLVTTSVISWPVVIGGGAVATGLIATGAWQGSKVVQKARQRLLATSRATIAAHLVKGIKKPSLLEQYGEMLDATVEKAKQAA